MTQTYTEKRHVRVPPILKQFADQWTSSGNDKTCLESGISIVIDTNKPWKRSYLLLSEHIQSFNIDLGD